MTAMQLTILSVLGLVAIVVSVGLIVDSRLGQPAPATTFAMSGEDTYARRVAFEGPVVTLLQRSAPEDGWDWRYESDRKACVGRQVIGNQNTGEPIEVTGQAIAIGTTGLAEVTMPAGATVYPSMDLTMGSTSWAIPYLSARVVDSHARAVFHGGVFAEAPEGEIPNTQEAVAQLDVYPVTAHECYGVVKAVWQEQVVVAVGPAFQQHRQELTVFVDDFPVPQPTPSPAEHFRGMATWPAEYDTTNSADLTAENPEPANGGTTEGTRHAEDLTTELDGGFQVPGYEWLGAHFFHQSGRVEAGYHSLEIPGCFDSGAPLQRYAVAQPTPQTFAHAIIIDGFPQTSAWYPSADTFKHKESAYTIYLSALLLDCRVIGEQTMELKP